MSDVRVTMTETATEPAHGAARSPSLPELGLSAACLSASQAAVFLGLAPEHARRIQQLGQQGRLPRVRVGKTFVYPVAGLASYVRDHGHTIRPGLGRESQAE